jgi:hypothetical protein
MIGRNVLGSVRRSNFKLLMVGAQISIAVRTVMVRVLTGIHTIWHANAGPASVNKRRSKFKTKERNIRSLLIYLVLP